MALTKQPVPINFSKGLETKTDPKQISIGNFLSLENSVFDKGGLLQKRNGYGMLTPLPDTTSTFLTTFNGNLTAIGSSLKAYSNPSDSWIQKATIQPIQMNTLPLIRSGTNQSQADSAVSSNGLVCTVFTDNVTSGASSTTATYKYVIADATTGQNIIAPTAIPVASGVVEGSPRVFILGRYFVIVFTNNISGSYSLKYTAISTYAPALAANGTTISSQYTPASTVDFDGVVVNNTLYLAWNGSDGGNAIRMTYIDSTLVQHSTVVFAGRKATIMSVCADTTNATPVIYAVFYDSVSTNGYALGVNQALNTVLTPTQIITAENVANITSVATNNRVTFLYEINNNYTYDSAIASHYVEKNTITSAGVVGTKTTLLRSVGLASKAFYLNDVIYAMMVYGSSFQPTYFLSDTSANTIAKLAYSNGYGYYTTGLPNVTVTDSLIQLAYLVKDQITSVNKIQGATVTAGVYSQTGINLVSMDLGTTVLVPAEIGSNLNISGGIVWAYDGYSLVEQGFHLWPDSVEATALADPTFTGDTTNTSATILNVSSVANLKVGMKISGTGIPANTTILSIGTTSLVLSAAATATNTGVTFTATTSVTNQQYFYQVTYEWTDNQGNVFRSAPSIPVSATTSAGHTSVILNIPTLRITQKTANPVRIVIYRWSTAQQTYYQITSLAAPLMNSLTVDYVTYQDISTDAQILGNAIIYTTGGVIENIGPPSASTMTLFKSRLFLVDSEDRNLLWYSKQVIENTPVEMSDLFTIFVAPTSGAQTDTGGMTALSALDDKLIIFKRNAIYYLTGTGPDNTGANNDFSEPVFITSTVGCVNQQSIVFMPQGLMFQSDKGIWLLGRDLSTVYIGSSVERFTTDALVQSALNIPSTNQVRFTMDTGITLMYDYFFGQWGTFSNVPAISSAIYQNLHTYINNLGQVFQETPGTYLDGSRPVLMSFLTGWLNLMGLQGYERAYYFYLIGTYITPHKLSIKIAYDYNDSPSQNTIITPDNFSQPWGGEQLWGSNTPWGGPSNVEQWRVFLQQQKCQAFQIGLNEIYDPSFGTAAGAGFTLSGMNLVIGAKSGYPRIKSANSAG